MTPEKQRIKIAEACPFVYKSASGDPVWDFDFYGGQTIFDPLYDLNAMNGAEKVLTDLQWHRYLQELAKVVREKGQAEIRISQYVRATAAQRAEAFLCTLGLWEEGQ